MLISVRCDAWGTGVTMDTTSEYKQERPFFKIYFLSKRIVDSENAMNWHGLSNCRMEGKPDIDFA